MSRLGVNARMYAVTPTVAQDWTRLLTWVLAQAEVDAVHVHHPSPAPMDELWRRDDLGLVWMCGLPFAQRQPRPTLIAAPVPSPERYGGRPIYHTDLVVAADSAFQSLEDTFGGVIGYTLAGSMSGGVALREHLRPLHLARGGCRLYRASVGGLVNAQGVVEAITAGRIDVGPMDGYSHDLLRRNAPDVAAKVRVVATTRARPIPPLVATADLAPDVVDRLRSALRAACRAPDLLAVRDRLLLEDFVVPAAGAYDFLADESARADDISYEEL